MNFDFVYKICTKSEWNDAKENKIFKGTPLDLKDGFIHFSDISQVKQTLNKSFFVIAILISEFESEGDPKQSKMEM